MKSLVITAVLVTASASVASAQDLPRLQLGAGIGVAAVNWSVREESRSLTGPALDARIGWRIGKRTMAGALFGFYGMNDEKPRIDDINFDGPDIDFNRIPKVADTRTWLGFVQWSGPSGVFVRPAVGLGRHAFAVYMPYPPNVSAGEGGEWGLAFSIAAGKEFRRSSRLGFGAEGFFVYSRGEDSSSPRQIVGVQIVPLLRVR